MYFRKNPIPKTNTKRIRPIIYFRSQKPNQFRTPIWKDPFLLGIGPKISEQGPTPWKPRTPPPRWKAGGNLNYWYFQRIFENYLELPEKNLKYLNFGSVIQYDLRNNTYSANEIWESLWIRAV